MSEIKSENRLAISLPGLDLKILLSQLQVASVLVKSMPSIMIWTN